MRRRVCVSLRSLARILNLQMHYITDVMNGMRKRNRDFNNQISKYLHK